MQTFLPYPDFTISMIVLDYRRLGKQRVEAKQILNAIYRFQAGIKSGWVNHPAVLMWIGYEEALKEYANTAISEWIQRGFVNNMELYEVGKVKYPPWFGKHLFHSSHRSNLLRKDFEYYGKFNWREPDNLPYYWPVKKGK